MTALDPDIGRSWYGALDDSQVAPLLGGQCILDPNTATEPTHLCVDQGSDLYRVIRFVDPVDTISPIYGIGDMTEPWCTGSYWSISQYAAVQEGWLCLAATAIDNAGNVGISPPLRVCYDDGVDPPPNCDSVQPPSCSQGCQPPGHFPYASQTSAADGIIPE
jgi:hypothetical protein